MFCLINVHILIAFVKRCVCLKFHSIRVPFDDLPASHTCCSPFLLYKLFEVKDRWDTVWSLTKFLICTGSAFQIVCILIQQMPDLLMDVHVMKFLTCCSSPSLEHFVWLGNIIYFMILLKFTINTQDKWTHITTRWFISKWYHPRRLSVSGIYLGQ